MFNRTKALLALGFADLDFQRIDLSHLSVPFEEVSSGKHQTLSYLQDSGFRVQEAVLPLEVSRDTGGNATELFRTRPLFR
jgi:hypothetical protein